MATDRPPPLTGVERIAAERRRQVEEENWTAEHDDQHEHGEMVEAAVAYLTHRVIYWPWEHVSFKPLGTLRDLVKAGALIAAEIDRLERAREAAGG